MSTLLLRLAAPLWARGTGSKFEVRRTNHELSKSRVVSLLAAALGLRRDTDLSELSALRFSVRVDRNGKVIENFHMAKAEKASYLTYRYYLSDTIFLVELESEDRSFLEEIESILRNPCSPLFPGRRLYPPTLPLVLGIRGDMLEITLREEEDQNKDSESIQQSHRYIRLDCGMVEQEGAVVQDLPIPFNPMKREFGYRRVKEIWLQDDVNTGEPAEGHDTVAELWKEGGYVSDKNGIRYRQKKRRETLQLP